MKSVEDLFSPPQNFAGLSAPYSDLETAKVVILPVPYDSTTEWHSGAREGPSAIISASRYLELYDAELGQEIYKVGIHTLPEISPSLNSPEKMIQSVYRVTGELIHRAKFVVMLGGEHSLSLGVIRAFKEKYQDLCVLQLDAHADLRDEYLGTKYSHACVIRRALDVCPVTQVGIRSLSWEEQQFLNQNKMQPFCVSPLTVDSGLSKKVIASLANYVYVSIDLDVFDPSIMSAVGTPEPGGMLWYEVLDLLESVIKNKHVVGFDLVELCPREGPASCAFLAAKLAYKLIGYAVLRNENKEQS